MTCRDIIIAELKRLGADGLLCNEHWCECKLANACNGLLDCAPAKLINGKWEPVDDKLEKVIMVEMPRREGKVNFYELYKKTVEDKKKYYEWEISGGTYKYCPYCGLEIKEVKP
jgi:hypothetical protein